MKKRIISLALVLVLVISIPLGALAVTTPSLKFSYSSSFAITVSSDQLIFTLPSDSDFAYVRISLTDANDKEYNLEWAKRQSDNTVVYSLKNVKNGTYYTQLFTSSTQYGNYSSYIIGRNAKLVVKDGSVYFELAPTYETNTLVYNMKRSDSAALLYYLEPSDGIQSDNKAIITLAESITKDVLGDFERARAIHDWVCNNIWYDDDVLYERAPYGEQSALSTFNTKRGICLGYANLTAALLRASGIPAKVVTGYALGVNPDDNEWTKESSSSKQPANHAWNEFFANGRWVLMDTTWDTTNSYARGVYSKDTGLYNYYYFDMTMEVFSYEHLIYVYSENNIPAYAEPEPESVPDGMAAPTKSKVVLNDREVTFECYNINGENYFKLRDVAYSINGTSKQFNALYDTSTKSIALITKTPYIPDGSEMKQGDGTAKAITPTSSKIYKDGKEITLTAYLIGGNNFFKMRDIASAFNIFVDYVDGVIIVDTSRSYKSS